MTTNSNTRIGIINDIQKPIPQDGPCINPALLNNNSDQHYFQVPNYSSDQGYMNYGQYNLYYPPPNQSHHWPYYYPDPNQYYNNDNSNKEPKTSLPTTKGKGSKKGC